MVIIGKKTLRETLGINVIAQLKASVLKEHGRQGGAGMGLTTRALGEPNAGAMLRAAMAVMALGRGGNAPGDVDDDVIFTLLSQQPMTFRDSEVEMQDRVGALGTVVDDAVDHGLPPACSKIVSTLTYFVGRCWATHLRACNL